MPIKLAPPLRFRFQDPDDVAAYGDSWWVWDEAAVARLRVREQIALEETVGMPLRMAIELFHEDMARGGLVVMWVALHLAGHEVKWDHFNPIWLATDWQRVPKEATPPLDSGEETPTPDSPSSTGPSPESASSSPN